MSMNIVDEVNYYTKDLKSMEHVLGRGLNIPFNSSNSASRKLMYSLHTEQIMPLIRGEVAYLSTGYENQYARKSSAFVTADRDYQVLAKFSKFPAFPDLAYYLVLKDVYSNYITIIEKVSYNHNTESYGYLYNTDYLDTCKPGDVILEEATLRKTLAYDENNNRQDGINATVAYMAVSETMEDGIILGKSFSRKFDSPLIKKVMIVLNDNDIPLNLHGDTSNYKIFPDVGEKVKDGTLFAIRREKNEEAFFNQSFQRLQEVMISDEQFIIPEGKVIDVNIFCNNPEIMVDNPYCGQINYYHQTQTKLAWDMVQYLKQFTENPQWQCSIELLEIYNQLDKVVKGYQWMKEGKVFSFCAIELVILEENIIAKGDKLTNRYGGKGVVSDIWDDELMPILDNGEQVQLIYNFATVKNRLNVGQLKETTVTFIGSRLLESLKNGLILPEDERDIYIKYAYFVSPKYGAYLENVIKDWDATQLAEYMEHLNEYGGIHVCIEPISEDITIQSLRDIYKEFDFIEPYRVMVPIKSSNGSYRYIEGRRRLFCGKEYIHRLKQYAEEKFSVTALSATNIRNENTRSKASKNYKDAFSRTPVSFGNMEMGSLASLGSMNVVEFLMIHSASPIARRLTEQILVDDPYNVNITLTDNCSNRGVEILNVYFKAMGLRLRFKRTRKKLKSAVMIDPVRFAIGKNPHELKIAATIADEAERSFKALHPELYMVPESKYKNAVRFDPVKMKGYSVGTVYEKPRLEIKDEEEKMD